MAPATHGKTLVKLIGGVLLSLVFLVATGCASTARYPVRTLDAGDVAVGGGMHGSAEGLIPAVTGQARYGLNDIGDLGVHAGIDGYTRESGAFGAGNIAAGLSYRHYVLPWLRLGIESTYHYADQTSHPRDYEDNDQTEFGGPSLVTQTEYVDDSVAGRAVVEFAKNWRRIGIHGGPVIKSGLWIPDSNRPDRHPDTGEPIEADWFGLGLGLFGGIGFHDNNGLSVQFDTQFMPLHVARLSTEDFATADPLSMNILKITIGVGYRF